MGTELRKEQRDEEEEKRESAMQERGQGLRLERGSGGLGARKRIVGELKPMKRLQCGGERPASCAGKLRLTNLKRHYNNNNNIAL